MIFFIAPYSKKFLGASRKIELLLGVLYQIDSNLVLINSWVDATNGLSPFMEVSVNDQIVSIRQYFLPAKTQNRFFNSIFNYVRLRGIENNLISEFGKPDHIWLYNSYFLEASLAIKLRENYNCKLILEAEDSCFSRARGLNPKPYLDFLAWKKLMSIIDHAFAVNQTLAKEIEDNHIKVSLLPGLISSELVRVTNDKDNLPFRNRGGKIKIGYFGGLSDEKGARMLIDLFHSLSDNFQFIVTGTGVLENEIKHISRTYPDRFKYYGQVSSSELIKYIADVDVFLNPHKPMEEMKNGVFPFKIMEAIASKRLIISTSLAGNQDFEETLNGIVFLNYNLQDWVKIIESAEEIYNQRQNIIYQASEKAIGLFSEKSLMDKLIRL